MRSTTRRLFPSSLGACAALTALATAPCAAVDKVLPFQKIKFDSGKRVAVGDGPFKTHSLMGVAPDDPDLAGARLGPDLRAVVMAQENPIGYFDRLFPQPTGRNGYEEFVLAGDLAHRSALLSEAVRSATSTLLLKRRVLADPNARRALALLRQGLVKPIRSRHEGQPIDEETVFPELADFRQLAHLLAIEQYVLLADGKVGQAIASLRDGLRFGYAVQMDTILGGFSGIAVDAIVLVRFVDHLDQLSVGDCDRLLDVVTEWLGRPDPAIAIYATERDLALQRMVKYRMDGPKILDYLRQGFPEQNEEEDGKALLYIQQLDDLLQSDPLTAAALIDQAKARVETHFNRLITNIRLPYWQCDEIEERRAGTLTDFIANSCAGSYAQTRIKFTQEQAYVQMLGVHASIHKYQWEHGRLPASLRELRSDLLARDPFTGQPFLYQF